MSMNATQQTRQVKPVLSVKAPAISAPAPGNGVTAKLHTVKAASAKPKKITPAFVPRAQNWDQHPSPITLANMYTLWSATQKATLDQLARDASVPILAMTGTLREEIRYITHALPNSEYAIFLALRRIDENRPHFLAYDFFMPAQTASGGGVSLDPKDCQRHFNNLKEHEYYKKHGTHRHLCHLHSHAGMSVFWSATDNTQQLTREDLGFMDDFRFYCVVNTKDEIKCSLVVYKPVLSRVDGIVAISYGSDGHALELTRKRRKELDEMIAEAVSHPVSNWGTGKVTDSEFEDVKKAPCRGGWNDESGVGGAWAMCGTESKDAQAKPAATKTASYGFRPDADGFDPATGEVYAPTGKWDSKNFVDPRNQPTNLNIFAGMATYRSRTLIPTSMFEAFFEQLNVAESTRRIASEVLRWLVDQTGVYLGPDGSDPALLGELFGQYVAEFVEATQSGGNLESICFLLSEDTQKAIMEENRLEAFKCMVTDLIDIIAAEDM